MLIENVAPRSVCLIFVGHFYYTMKASLLFFYDFVNQQGSNSTMSLDGQDKLCGYQKSMFPLCIYGGLDTYSGRMNFLRVWTTNNNPLVIGRFYLEYLFKSRGRMLYCFTLFIILLFLWWLTTVA